jgi:hypothetical protein
MSSKMGDGSCLLRDYWELRERNKRSSECGDECCGDELFVEGLLGFFLIDNKIIRKLHTQKWKH